MKKGRSTIQAFTVPVSNKIVYILLLLLFKSVFKFENPRKLVQKVKFTETNETQVIVKEINEEGFLVEVKILILFNWKFKN